MSNRKYCCYRHFKQGKHDLSCTHCYDHVQLGVINPPHSPGKKIIKQQPPALHVRSKPFRIQNRTHDYNEVQHKGSLPQRLSKPRVYVEKIVDKNERSQPLLPIKHSGSAEYEQTVKLFRKIGESLPQKTKHSLTTLIRSYALQKMYIKASQSAIFFTKPQFVDFILQNFKKFSHEQADMFWAISYNQLRFNERISMEAFVFNFYKFFLQGENINNTFSQTALRQRLVDLRVLLFQWAQNQVNLKYNLREMRQSIKEVEDTLKLSTNEEMLCDFHIAVQNSRLAHIRLKLLSEVLFKLTDNKFLYLKKIKLSIHSKLQERVRRMQTCRNILQRFFETNNFTPSQKFPITDLIQFCKTEECKEQQIADTISWIQGLFQYLYYYQPEDAELGLTLNLQTKRLQCVNILTVDSNVVREYDRFLENVSDIQVDCCREILVVLEDGLMKMPLLEGHKKDIVQCNYVAEIVLRYVRAIDLSPFWRVTQVILQCRNGVNQKRIAEIFKSKPTPEQIKKNMKGLFTIQRGLPVHEDNSESQPLTQAQIQPIHSSLQKYRQVKQQQLLIKLQPDPKLEKQQQEKNQYAELDRILRESEKNQAIEGHGSEKDEMHGDPPINYCSKYWLEASRETNDTIASVESLESQLFSLLNLEL